MTNYARIINGVAIDVTSDLENSFHPIIAAEFVVVPDEVSYGWKLSGKTWNPPVYTPPVEPPEVYSIISPMTFQMLFSSQERIAIKGLTSTNPVVEDWWGIVNDPRLTEVDLNLKSVQDALDYITSIGVLVEGRKEEILSGIVK